MYVPRSPAEAPERAPSDSTIRRIAQGVDPEAMRKVLEARRETRRQQIRFRRDPEKYLSALEKELIQLALTP